jgi:hypothetical protein
MSKTERGIEERAVATAALAGRTKGISLGPEARKLAEKHSSDELREKKKSDASKTAEKRKAHGDN